MQQTQYRLMQQQQHAAQQHAAQQHAAAQHQAQQQQLMQQQQQQQQLYQQNQAFHQNQAFQHQNQAFQNQAFQQFPAGTMSSGFAMNSPMITMTPTDIALEYARTSGNQPKRSTTGNSRRG